MDAWCGGALQSAICNRGLLAYAATVQRLHNPRHDATICGIAGTAAHAAEAGALQAHHAGTGDCAGPGRPGAVVCTGVQNLCASSATPTALKGAQSGGHEPVACAGVRTLFDGLRCPDCEGRGLACNRWIWQCWACHLHKCTCVAIFEGPNVHQICNHACSCWDLAAPGLLQVHVGPNDLSGSTKRACTARCGSRLPINRAAWEAL